MAATVVVGAQWGDEGKGKIVDFLAGGYDCVARYNGGNNAGHTVKLGAEEYKLHLVPSGILYPHVLNVVGNGVVVDPKALYGEISELRKRGVDVRQQKASEPGGLVISGKANLIFPWHTFLDGAQERGRGSGKIGTTNRGIGPAYAEKACRTEALRAGDALKPDFTDKVWKTFESKNEMIRCLYGSEISKTEVADYIGSSIKLSDFVGNTSELLNDFIKNRKNVLLEGAQGTLLDVDHGTFPYVTSSNATAGGACTGAGIGPTRIGDVMGVSKAYTTRVGEGAMPTELNDEIGARIRQVGNERGTTTGRDRRVGWLDTVILRYSNMVNFFEGLALTKIDVLGDLHEVKVCYAYEIDGTETNKFPDDDSALRRARPVYETFDGFEFSRDDWLTAKSEGRLPKSAESFVQFIEDETDVPVKIVSFGPDRNDTVDLRYPRPEKNL